jgi:DNA-binding GntR family transcriptional regulator
MAVTRGRSNRKQSDAGLAQVIYEGLCEEIVSGKLRPGEPLSRRQIAQRYGTSYTPVVEAMIRLEHAGMIDAASSQVARVVRLSVERIHGLFTLFEAYQTQAIRAACQTATAQEIEELYAKADALDARTALRDPQDNEVPSLHIQFHKRLVRLGRCPELYREFDRLEVRMVCQHMWLVTALAREDPPRWHARLVDAIQKRDPLAADEMMRVHVRLGMEKELLAYQMHLTEIDG